MLESRDQSASNSADALCSAPGLGGCCSTEVQAKDNVNYRRLIILSLPLPTCGSVSPRVTVRQLIGTRPRSGPLSVLGLRRPCGISSRFRRVPYLCLGVSLLSPRPALLLSKLLGPALLPGSPHFRNPPRDIRARQRGFLVSIANNAEMPVRPA